MGHMVSLILMHEISSSSSLFLFHLKEQLKIIKIKIEQRLQIGRQQLNDIRYNNGGQIAARRPFVCGFSS